MRGHKVKISADYAAFITDNSTLMSIPKLVDFANQQGFECHNVGTIQRFIRVNKLPIKQVRHLYSPAQVAFIVDNQHLTRDDLLIAMNEKFKTQITSVALNVFCSTHKIKCLNTDHLYQKGNNSIVDGVQCNTKKGVAVSQSESSRKTQFKHDHTLNHKALGYERIDAKTGLIEVRVSTRKTEKGNFFRRKHIVIWESVHGAIPRAHAVVFLDGDKRNFDIDNLMLMSIGAVAMREKIASYKDAPAALKPAINVLTKLVHKHNQMEK